MKRRSSPRVAVLRCENLPAAATWDIPDVDALFSDDRMIADELAKLGAVGESVVWTDPGIDWNEFDVALIRSTWDYIDDRARFLSVLEAIDASSCILLNPLDTVRWNTDKRYLLDLQRWGIPVVPTLLAKPDDAAATQDEVVRRGWTNVIVKPAVGAGGADVRLVSSTDVASTLVELVTGRLQRDFVVQPLAESIRTEGEISFVFVERELNHVLLKKPAAGDYRSHDHFGGTMKRIEPGAEDRAQADAIIGKLPFNPLYTRLDVVRIDGRLAVMELELIEPVLYFHFAPEGAGRLAAATLARLGRG